MTGTYDDSDSDLITSELIQKHLVEMGYSPNALPPDVLEDFVKELKDLYMAGAFHEEPATVENNDNRSISSSPQNYTDDENHSDLIDSFLDSNPEDYFEFKNDSNLFNKDNESLYVEQGISSVKTDSGIASIDFVDDDINDNNSTDNSHSEFQFNAPRDQESYSSSNQKIIKKLYKPLQFQDWRQSIDHDDLDHEQTIKLERKSQISPKSKTSTIKKKAWQEVLDYDKLTDDDVSTNLSQLDLNGYRNIAKRQYLRSGSVDLSVTDRSVDTISSIGEDYDTQSMTSTKSKSTRSKIRPSSGFIRVPPTPRPKKHDPVARFHQHKEEWSKNDFLKRVEKKPSNVREAGRWGGMAAIVHEQPRKQ
ncbi:hypothetical protein HDV02_000314 [Globomyces sp. JEL0801]|nr:hypothetical protein HDV02_000314 [Globomyces sp. JEL0801]